MRPLEILTTWSCEELLVAYGTYANAHSKENYDMMTQAERRKKKLSYFDRWAMPFFLRGDVEKLAEAVSQENAQAQEMGRIAEALFS